MSRYWRVEEILYLKENLHLSDKNLAIKLDRTINSIKWRRIKERVLRKRENIWTDEETQFLMDNKDIPVKFIAEKLGRTMSSIYKKRHQQKITNNKYGANVKYTMNMNFFKVWTEEMAYIVGFIFADGWISINKSGYRLGIGSIDKELLLSINHALDSSYPIKKKKGTKKSFYTITIYRKEIVFDLIKLGVIQRKSLIMKFPVIPKDYFWPFIRGYFDGDGHTSSDKRGRLKLIIYSGSKDFIDEMNCKLQIRGIDTNLKYGKSAHELTIRFSGKEYFYKKMYENSSIYLHRKYDLINKYYESRFLICVDCKQKYRKRSSSHKRCDVCSPIYRKKRISEYGGHRIKIDIGKINR